MTFVGLNHEIPPEEIDLAELSMALDDFLEESGFTEDIKLTVLDLTSSETASEKTYTYTFMADDEAQTVFYVTGFALEWHCGIVHDDPSEPEQQTDPLRTP
jgi:hypothetical protein